MLEMAAGELERAYGGLVRGGRIDGMGKETMVWRGLRMEGRKRMGMGC